MSDTGDRTLASVFYPDSGNAADAGLQRAKAFSAAGVAGTAPSGPALRDVPTEASPAARALYGGGQAATPIGPSGMAGESWRGTPIRDLPLSADPDAHDLHARLRSAPADQAEPAAPSSDAEPQPTVADQQMMEQFEAATASLTTDDRQRLLTMHEQAVQQMYEQHEKTAAEWRAQTEKQFNSQQLSDIRSRFNNAIGNGKDAQEFRRLLAWSGIGNNPSAIRTISKLLARR